MRVDGVMDTAFAALAITLGCPFDRVGELWDRMRGTALPSSPQEAVADFLAQMKEMGLRTIAEKPDTLEQDREDLDI